MINDFKVEVTLTSDEGVVYVFENATLPKYVLQAVDTFSDEVEQGLEMDYSYNRFIKEK
jgi:hypothetical protein